MNALDKLNRKIFKKEKTSDMLDIWHYLMLNYGWIPLGEFLDLPTEITDKLVLKLNKLNEKKKHGR